MRLNTRARYALRAMIQIARSTDANKPINLNDIAGKTGVTRRYLEQVIIPLKSASLVKGMAGKDGGYVLAKPSKKIKVGDIIQAAIGPINIVNCVKDPDSCMKTDWCECRPLYVLMNEKITDALNDFTLTDLVNHNVKRVTRKQQAESKKNKKEKEKQDRRG
jgi:Rrf2 family protein